jgi:hypothetical protein
MACPLYRLATLPDGSIGLVFNKIRWEGRGESYVGAYYTTVDTNAFFRHQQPLANDSAFYRYSAKRRNDRPFSR